MSLSLGEFRVLDRLVASTQRFPRALVRRVEDLALHGSVPADVESDEREVIHFCVRTHVHQEGVRIQRKDRCFVRVAVLLHVDVHASIE